MSRWLAAAFLCLWCVTACSNADGVSPPNIVLIIGDDHGYPDFGFMGSPIARTPRLDRLAAEGTTFTIGYATASVCRPSLRSLLTGLHPLQFDIRESQLKKIGVQPSPRSPIRQNFQTLPALLSQRGYATFQSGKFQEGPYWNAGFTHGMTELPGDAGRKQGARIGRETMEPVYSFIDAHADQPFFVWFAPQIPHHPHNPPPEFLAPYESLGLPPGAVGYFGCVTWFDHLVEELIDHIDRSGLRERTLIVYVADNGWQPPGPGVRYTRLLGGTKGKISLYELGFRTPVIFNWPGTIPGDVRSDDLVSLVDLFPTLLGYAGLPPPHNRFGVDLRPSIDGTGPPEREELIGTARFLRTDQLGERRGGSFRRTRRWHYLWFNDGSQALFDLEADPDETRDVSEQYPDIVKASRSSIRRWKLLMQSSVLKADLDTTF
jgi:uncharacterized sulfatase